MIYLLTLIKKFFKIKNEITLPSHQMKLAFYIAKHGTLKDKFIAKSLKSKYSHVELVFSDNVSFSASPRDKGIRFKNIKYDNNSHWDLYEILTPLNESVIREKLSKLVGQPYDTLGAIGSGLNLPLYSKNKKFCSLLIASIFNLKNINQNPESLRQTLLKLKHISKIS